MERNANGTFETAVADGLSDTPVAMPHQKKPTTIIIYPTSKYNLVVWSSFSLEFFHSNNFSFENTYTEDIRR